MRDKGISLYALPACFSILSVAVGVSWASREGRRLKLDARVVHLCSLTFWAKSYNKPCVKGLQASELQISVMQGICKVRDFLK